MVHSRPRPCHGDRELYSPQTDQTQNFLPKVMRVKKMDKEGTATVQLCCSEDLSSESDGEANLAFSREYVCSGPACSLGCQPRAKPQSPSRLSQSLPAKQADCQQKAAQPPSAGTLEGPQNTSILNATSSPPGSDSSCKNAGDFSLFGEFPTEASTLLCDFQIDVSPVACNSTVNMVTLFREENPEVVPSEHPCEQQVQQPVTAAKPNMPKRQSARKTGKARSLAHSDALPCGGATTCAAAQPGHFCMQRCRPVASCEAEPVLGVQSTSCKLRTRRGKAPGQSSPGPAMNLPLTMLIGSKRGRDCAMMGNTKDSAEPKTAKQRITAPTAARRKMKRGKPVNKRPPTSPGKCEIGQGTVIGSSNPVLKRKREQPDEDHIQVLNVEYLQLPGPCLSHCVCPSCGSRRILHCCVAFGESME